MGQMIWAGLCWAYLSTAGFTGVLVSPPTTNELTDECSFEGICRGASESKLKHTGLLGPGFITAPSSLLSHSIGHIKFMGPNPKSRSKRWRCRLEGKMEQ